MERYSRQLNTLPQDKLLESSVTVIGAGGLGSPALLYLAAAGIGKIKIVDHERIEISNLNRQVLYKEKDIGKNKSITAAERLGEMNSGIELEAIDARVSGENAIGIIKGSDVVLDCLDNWETRFVINKACVEEGIPLVHGAVEGMSGQLMTIIPDKTACLACLFRDHGSKKPEVVGFAAGIVGCLEGMEAVKLIAGKKTLQNEILFVDLETDEFRKIEVSKKKGCEVCG